jgi:cell pole-organizing protein PopZ
MSDAKGQHEPSMEEILASIRRIIAEDNDAPEAGTEGEAKAPAATAEPAPAAAAPASEDEDVLELTEVVEEEPMADAPAPKAPTELELVAHSEPLPPEDEAEEDRLISTASAAASVAALSQLVQRPRDRTSELPMGTVDRTLEDLIRELVRPLLKSWLDENLPLLVERLVRDEIGRLVREAQGR